MEAQSLTVAPRKERGRTARRVAGTRIPAVIYGHGTESQAVWVEAAPFARAFAAAGESGIINVVIDGAKAVPTIVRGLQRDPLTYAVAHVDFYHVSLKEAVTAEVPVVFTGESAAVKQGGTLIHGVDVVEVRALPQDLPHEITVDVSVLKTYDDSITVADLMLPENVVAVTDASVLVAAVAPPRVEKGDAEDAAQGGNGAAEEEATAQDA